MKVPVVVVLVTTRVLLPDIVMLVGLRVAVRPVDGLTVAVRLTVPLNPLTGVTLIVDVPDELVETVRLVGLAVIVKSGVVTWRVMTAVVWCRSPLVPVTVTVKSPLVPAISDSVVLSNPPERLSIVLPSVALSPADGLVVSETFPAKPLTLLAAMVVMQNTPGVQLIVTGVLGEIAKSLKLNVAVAV